MSRDYAKCECQSCGNPIEFPEAGAGTTIECPHCGQATELSLAAESPPDFPEERQSAGLSAVEVLAGFSGTIKRPSVSLFYHLGLLLVTVMMVVLPVVYLVMIGCVAWAVYYYATHFFFLLQSTAGGLRLLLLKLALYAAPLFAGAVVVVFMIKPLFARRPRQAESLALNPAVEKTLFAFIARICDLVGAPMPARIDLDCNLNASARFRRGGISMLGNDLALTIGLPLVAGLNTRQLAGVIAHEFGHFTQGFGLRLSYVIRSVNGWFARVVYERDAWDVSLENAAAEADDWRISIVIGCAQLGVWFSRQLLNLLMLLGHGVSCFLLRQMEYDADSCEIRLAGSSAFESTALRLRVLGAALGNSYKEMRVGWNQSRALPDNFPEYLMHHESRLPDATRQTIMDTAGLARTGIFHTHPSDGDRIRAARKANEPGVFALELPAAALFSNFSVVSRQVTQLHYADDLGIPVQTAVLRPLRTETRPADEPSPQAAEPAPGGRLRVKLSRAGQPPPPEAR